jgi:hypothetical protein
MIAIIERNKLLKITDGKFIAARSVSRILNKTIVESELIIKALTDLGYLEYVWEVSKWQISLMGKVSILNSKKRKFRKESLENGIIDIIEKAKKVNSIDPTKLSIEKIKIMGIETLNDSHQRLELVIVLVEDRSKIINEYQDFIDQYPMTLPDSKTLGISFTFCESMTCKYLKGSSHMFNVWAVTENEFDEIKGRVEYQRV